MTTTIPTPALDPIQLAPMALEALGMYAEVVCGTHTALRSSRVPSRLIGLRAALASFALEHPERELSAVSAVEFAEWFASKGVK